MQHTLAAIFNSQDDALDAMKALLAAGFNPTDVNVASANATSHALTDASALVDEVRKEGVGTLIKQFFTHLFGDDNDEHASRNSDAVSRGQHVLSLVTGSEYEVKLAANIIERFGPADIENPTGASSKSALLGASAHQAQLRASRLGS